MAGHPTSDNGMMKNTIEISIRLILLFLLIAWCLVLLVPFITPVIWGIIIAVSVTPLYNSINRKLNDMPKTSASFLVLAFLAKLLIPAYFIIDSSVEGLRETGNLMKEGNVKTPPPTEKVKDLQLFGEKLYGIWAGFSENLENAILKYSEQVKRIGKWLLGVIVVFTGDVVKFVLSIIIAGVLLATKGTDELSKKFFIKMVGDRGEEFKKIAEVTIGNVTKGVLGVAFIQSTLLGIIFLLADIPYAGVWATLCLILGIIQLSPSFVSIPIIIYLYSTISPTMATVWTVLIMIAGLSDNILKPILLGKGAPVPMLVIFLGSLGGFITSGFIGLFTGAIVLSLGYKLFIVWVNEEGKEVVEVNQSR